MKKRDLLSKISGRAAVLGKGWAMANQSGAHEKWRLGTTVQVSIPKHREINELTARSILKATESELGEGWWE